MTTTRALRPTGRGHNAAPASRDLAALQAAAEGAAAPYRAAAATMRATADGIRARAAALMAQPDTDPDAVMDLYRTAERVDAGAGRLLADAVAAESRVWAAAR